MLPIALIDRQIIRTITSWMHKTTRQTIVTEVRTKKASSHVTRHGYVAIISIELICNYTQVLFRFSYKITLHISLL